MPRLIPSLCLAALVTLAGGSVCATDEPTVAGRAPVQGVFTLSGGGGVTLYGEQPQGLPHLVSGFGGGVRWRRGLVRMEFSLGGFPPAVPGPVLWGVSLIAAGRVHASGSGPVGSLGGRVGYFRQRVLIVNLAVGLEVPVPDTSLEFWFTVEPGWIVNGAVVRTGAPWVHQGHVTGAVSLVIAPEVPAGRSRPRPPRGR